MPFELPDMDLFAVSPSVRLYHSIQLLRVKFVFRHRKRVWKGFTADFTLCFAKIIFIFSEVHLL